MRIALYVPSWPPRNVANGVVTYASHLVPALRELGHEVFVITSRTVDEGADAIDLRIFEPQTSSLTRRFLSRFAPGYEVYTRVSRSVLSAARCLVSRHRIDVFQIEDSFGWSAPTLAANLIPTVVRLHGPAFLVGRFGAEGARLAHRIRVRREGMAIVRATAVTAPSAQVLRATAEFYGHDFALSRVIPNAIQCAPCGEPWDYDTADRNLILYVGRFDRVKGGDVLLKAFGDLVRDHPMLRLAFVGPDIGVQTDQGRKNLLEYAKATLGDTIAQRVECFGVQDRTSIDSLRKRAALTIVSSRYETFSNAVLEAMAVGSPLVATAVGGIPELVKDERSALLVPPENPKAIASACRRLLGSRELSTRLARQGIEDARARHSPEAIASATVALYAEAVDAFRFEMRR